MNPFEDKTDYEQENKNNMAYWFPLLKQIKMRVPDTILIHSGITDLGETLEDGNPEKYRTFLDRLKSAINEIGLPCFLRTGQTSDKHSWKDTCYIDSDDDAYLLRHVANLVETSYMANIAGMPFDYSIWAIRRLIPTTPVLTYFNGMPITKERRLFISNGKVICNHPYWPKDAFDDGITDEQIAILHSLDEKDGEIELMAEYVGKFFKGYWSVDFLQDVDGNWWLTDMAVGERSYHYPNCNKEIK